MVINMVKPQTNKRLYAILLLALLGLIWGSGYSLARFATTQGVHPLGYAFWQSLGPTIFLILLFKFSKGNWNFSRKHLQFYLISGLLGIAIPNTNMYFAAPHLPAGILAVLVNTVPVITYLLAWFSQEESLSPGRLLGVFLCVIGMMVLVLPQTALPNRESLPWVFLTLITPLCFALCAVYSSKYRPLGSDSLMLSAGMLAASTLFLTPVIVSTHHFYPLWPPFHLRDGAIILEIILSSLGYILFFQLLKIAGAVYYSLVGGIVALTGIFWGIILFGEQLNLLLATAVFLIISGIFCVTLWKKT